MAGGKYPPDVLMETPQPCMEKPLKCSCLIGRMSYLIYVQRGGIDINCYNCYNFLGHLKAGEAPCLSRT